MSLLPRVITLPTGHHFPRRHTPTVSSLSDQSITSPSRSLSQPGRYPSRHPRPRRSAQPRSATDPDGTLDRDQPDPDGALDPGRRPQPRTAPSTQAAPSTEVSDRPWTAPSTRDGTLDPGQLNPGQQHPRPGTAPTSSTVAAPSSSTGPAPSSSTGRREHTGDDSNGATATRRGWIDASDRGPGSSPGRGRGQ